MLKKRRELERAAAPTGAASSHEVCELNEDLDLAPWEEPQESTDEALLWYEKEASKREALAEEAHADAGDSKFKVERSLRVSWLVAQRADPVLYDIMIQPD